MIIKKDMKANIARSPFEIGLATLIANSFADWKDFGVMSELRKYKPGEDVTIYGQKIGELPEICEVYYKGEYLCEIAAHKRPDEALKIIEAALVQRIASV